MSPMRKKTFIMTPREIYQAADHQLNIFLVTFRKVIALPGLVVNNK